MAARGESKTRASGNKACDAPCRSPRNNVVSLSANRVYVLLDAAQIDRLPEQRNLARFHQIILEIGVAEVEAVRGSRHPGAVAVPVEKIECRRLVAEQVVVNDRAPDEIVGAEQVEHISHIAT